MEYLTLMLQAMSGASSNMIRGRGILPQGNRFVRLLMSACWALPAMLQAALCMFTLSEQLMIGLIVFIGTFFWVTPGWGLYFSSFAGFWKKGETEQRWIDAVGMFLVPFVSENDMKSNLLRGTICMSLRGLYIAPLFVLLAVFFGDWKIALYGLGGLVQGPAYGVMRYLKDKDYAVTYAEPLIAAIFNVLIGAAIIQLSTL